MKGAIFSLVNYSFVKVNLDLENIPSECVFGLNFKPSGVYDENSGVYMLSLVFNAKCKEKNIDAVNVKLQATYKFQENLKFENIPSYFFANSIAIVFPYIRAFVSTVTLQANVAPIMLPTLNISTLGSKLSSNTVVK